MISQRVYQAKQFNLSGLSGISDRTLEMHFQIYEGYVKGTNTLLERIWDFLKDGKVIPVLVMDVWEHAYLLDYRPAERPKYIEAFFSNVDWDRVEERLAAREARRSIGEHS